jgi:hypothetical protein
VLPLLVLAALGFLVWVLNAPGYHFPRGLARLLEDARLDAGALRFLSGRSTVAGKFAGRDVVLRLHMRRGKHDQGHLMIAMRTREGPLDAAGVDAQATGDEARRALFTLARHDLTLQVEDGWLQARWRPRGFGFFPGPFVESKWRDVLEAMRAVATSLAPVS